MGRAAFRVAGEVCGVGKVQSLNVRNQVYRVNPQNESDQQQQPSDSQSKKTIAGKLSCAMI